MSRAGRIEIIPTCVPLNEADLSLCARAVSSYSSRIHIDIVDGLFAPACTWPYSATGKFEAFDLSGAADLQKEIHLMVKDPLAIGKQFARSGAFRIVGHVEAFSSANETQRALLTWRKDGAQEVGLGLLMGTSLDVIEPYIAMIDVVHLMTIAWIGTQGIPYEPRSVGRIAEFHARYPETSISIDGGVSESNIIDLVRAGAQRFGVGSAILKAKDPAASYAHLKRMAEDALV